MAPLETKEITQSRTKIAGVLMGCLVFALMAELLPSETGKPNSWRWFVFLFFGLGVLTSVWLCFRPQKLRLDGEGFEISGGLRRSSRKISWSDVPDFRVFRLSRGGKAIAFDFRPEAQHRSLLTSLNRGFGIDGTLPRLWPGRPEDLVEELNYYRTNASGETETARTCHERTSAP